MTSTNNYTNTQSSSDSKKFVPEEISLPEHLCSHVRFGQTVEIYIPKTGDFETCFTCHKPHRAFVPTNQWYSSNVCSCNFCCPVLVINLPPITHN